MPIPESTAWVHGDSTAPWKPAVARRGVAVLESAGRSRRSRGTSHGVVVLAILLAACAPAATTVPAPGVSPVGSGAAWVGDRLYFGRAMSGGGEVSEEAWRAFLAEVVTPRFPDGLTVWRADGQWRDSDGIIVREQTFVLEIYHDGAATADVAITEMVDDYKRRFQQAAVLRVTSPAMVRFLE